MMIIHSPQPWAEVNKSDNRYEQGNIEAYRALEDAQKAGKLHAIGVSNFLEADLRDILANCSVVPQVNQVLAHISNTPFDLIAFCEAKGIRMEANSPVAHGEAMRLESVVEMAQRYGVTVQQLCIRYCLQLGMVALPKTANPAHMRANANVEFEISEQDMELLKAVPRLSDYGAHSFFPVFGGKL